MLTLRYPTRSKLSARNRARRAILAASCLLGYAVALLAPTSLSAAFGLTSSGGFYTVDTNAGLVFKVNQSNGDISSLFYNGTEYQYSAKGSHINSGLGTSGVTVTGTTVGTDYIKITVTAPAAAAGGTLTHYYMARNGFSHIYMATHFTQEPDIGLVRFIVRIPNALLPNGPVPSDIRNTDTTIEASDIFAFGATNPNTALIGQTRSKHYSGQRLKDWSYTGATGTNVAAWMVRGHHEGGSSGPFYRSLINQCGDQQELYEIINYGEAQTEPFRFNVLNGPYTLVFTNGGVPPALDTSWVGGLGLTGYVAPAGRGAVACAGISNRDTSHSYTVGFANTAAQSWTTAAAADGAFTMSGIIPGTYTMNIYKNELAVYTASVSVAAGGTTTLPPITLTADPSSTLPLWRIGNWDGTPAEFLNGDKVTSMHPSDVRAGSWSPGTYTVGTSSPATGMPCYQWKDIAGGNQAIQFTLTAGQIAASTVRVGMTCANAGARPNIAVNSWTAGLQAASTQPTSRTLTVGTYRGNNVTYTFSVPASVLVVGTNTLYLYPISGSSSTAPYLSPGYSLDCVDLYQGTAQTLPVPNPPAAVTATPANAQVSLSWTASAGAASYTVQRAATSGGPYALVASGVAATTVTDSGVTNGNTYYYVVSASNSSGTGVNSAEVSVVPAAPAPTTPTGLAATPYNASASLSWNASDSATSYNIKRSLTSGTGYSTVQSSAALSYSDFGVANGTTYYYVVSAVNSVGESPNSTEVSVTPANGTTATFTSAAAQDGYIMGASSNATGSIATSTGWIRIGDHNANRQYKGIFSFDTSSIPADATILSATLKLKRSGLTGTSPFTILGTCYADIKGGTGFNGSTALETTDFQASADATQVATISDAASNNTWSTGGLNVTGIGWLNKTGTTQFRVYFATPTNNNSTYDYISWYAGDDATSTNRPVLEVTYSAQAPGSPPKVYLKFDESSGTTALDSSGNGWNGTLVNGPAWVAGKVNNAVSLDGTNDYVTMPAGVVSTLGDFTISAWVKLTTVGTWARIFDFGTSQTNYMFLTTSSNSNPSKVRFAIRTPAVAEEAIEGIPTPAISTGTWTHFAVSISGSTGTLYVNGTVVGTNSAMTLKPSSLGSTNLNYIGKSQFTNPYLNGLVDEFQIYNTALSASQVAQLAAPPATPTGLAATAGDGQIALSWGAAAGTGYNIKRAPASGGPYTIIATGITNTSYTDFGLANGTIYYYVVSTINGMGESANATPVSATPFGPPTTPAGLNVVSFNAAVSLNWTASAGAASYNVKRSTSSGGSYTTISSGAASTSYSDTSVTAGTTYYYAVSAVNATGESADSTQAFIVAAPAMPAGLAATPGDALVTLSWNVSGGATSYNVLRSTTNGTGYSTVANGVASTGYGDSSVTNGTTYYYVVSASNAGGESAWSMQASARPTAPISTAELQPPVLTIAQATANLSVKSSVVGHTYRLQYCDDLAGGVWQYDGLAQSGNGSDLQFTAPVTPPLSRRFFRILIQQ